MKKFLQLLVFLCVTTATYAQNATEAKLAYQLAEEKFDAKQYAEALDYLEKAETALGSTNPPMLFLKVMIINQIVTAKESTDNYRKLEEAISGFDKHKDKEALGEDKLMDVYRIKMDLDKRKAAYEKEANRIADLKRQYDEMVYRLAGEFPKTETTVRVFFSKIPTEWEEPRYGGQNYLKVTEKRIEKFVEWGGNDFNSTWNEGKIYLKAFKTHNSGEDRIKQYSIHKVIKYHSRKKNTQKRNLTIEEICEVLKITPQQWNDFTTGKKPLITTLQDEPEGYWIIGKSDDKNIKIFLYLKTWGWTTEEMRIDIFENTL